MIPYGRQDISEDDIRAVVEVLRSDFLTQGPAVPRFEEAVAEHCGARHAVASNSATSALHIACLAVGLGPGDRLWTSPNTFVASANVALHCGAQVDFVDIDPRTFNMSVERLAEKLAEAKAERKLPKVVMPVHFTGQSCDMRSIHTLSQEYGFKVIEDGSHAIGASYLGEPVGGCRYSDITVFSFHPVKIITTSEGGMSLTNDPELAARMRLFRTHGITSDRALMSPRPDGEIWNYQQIELGFNYRLTDIQAALGSSQLRRLSDFVDMRHEIARWYDEEFSNLPVTTPWQHPDTYSSYHLYVLRIDRERCGKTQRQVYDAMMADGIQVNLHYIPVHRQPYYEALGFREGHCPEAELYHREALSMPMFPTLREGDRRHVAAALKKAIGA